MSAVEDRRYVYQDVPREIRRLGGCTNNLQSEYIWESLWQGRTVRDAAQVEFNRAPCEVEPPLPSPIVDMGSSRLSVGALKDSAGGSYTARLRRALRGYGAGEK